MNQPRAVEMRRLRFVAILAVFIAAILAGWAISTSMRSSKQLLIQRVDIEGLNHLQREDVLALAELDTPKSTLNVQKRWMEARLRTSPWIDHVEVHQPGRESLTIRITEAVPRVIVATPQLMVASEQGQIIDQLTPRYNTLPLVTGASRKLPSDEAREAIDPETYALSRGLGSALSHDFDFDVVDVGVVRDAVRLIDGWQALDKEQRWGVKEVSWEAAEGFAMVVGDGVDLVVGSRDFDQRLRHAHSALMTADHARSAAVERIDVRPDQRAVLRFGKPVEATDP